MGLLRQPSPCLQLLEDAKEAAEKGWAEGPEYRLQVRAALSDKNKQAWERYKNVSVGTVVIKVGVETGVAEFAPCLLVVVDGCFFSSSPD